MRRTCRDAFNGAISLAHALIGPLSEAAWLGMTTMPQCHLEQFPLVIRDVGPWRSANPFKTSPRLLLSYFTLQRLFKD
jgi:hypothetical protein